MAGVKGIWSELFSVVRRVTVFLLGIAVMVEGLWGGQENPVPLLLIGMVMVGILPIENVLPWGRSTPGPIATAAKERAPR